MPESLSIRPRDQMSLISSRSAAIDEDRARISVYRRLAARLESAGTHRDIPKEIRCPLDR